MAKKLFAVTNIKHDDDFYEAGSSVDEKKFTAEQLKELYDAGAVEVRNVDDEPVAKEETPKEETPKVNSAKVTGPDTTVKQPTK